MAGRTEVAFLYQTRTILRLVKRAPLSRREFTSTRRSLEISAHLKDDPLSEKQASFDSNATDNAIPWSPPSRNHTRRKAGAFTRIPDANTTTSSTITASERRAFETILRLAPTKEESEIIKPRSPPVEFVDTDIDNILKIFNFSLRDHGSKQNVGRKEQSNQIPLVEDATEQDLLGPLVSSPQVRASEEIPQEEILHPWLPRSKPTSRAEDSKVESPIETPQEDYVLATHAQPVPISEIYAWSPFGRSAPPTHIKFKPSPSNPAELAVKPQTRVQSIRDRLALSIPINGSKTLHPPVLAEQTLSPVPKRTTLEYEPKSIDSVVADSIEEASPEDPDSAIYQPTASPNPTSPEVDPIFDSAVRERMSTISSLLDSAASSTIQRGDTAMWQTIETHIFSMAKHFQAPAASTQLQDTKKKTPMFGGINKFVFTREKSDQPKELIEAAEREARTNSAATAAQVPASVSTQSNSNAASDIDHTNSTSPVPSLSVQELKILQYIYPASLLLALRLYITHFPTSPYPFLLLPRIRSLGTTSYVLGASPQFYNSLLSLVWMVRSSLREVDALLGEMERGGVEMDEGTYKVLGGIEGEMNADLQGETGEMEAVGGVDKGMASRGAGWWRRQEQMLFFPRVLDWLDIIAGRLAAKERLEVN